MVEFALVLPLVLLLTFGAITFTGSVRVGKHIAATAGYKRLVLELEDDLFLVIHLMIAGRLRWRRRRPTP